jgi:hypothetical protein
VKENIIPDSLKKKISLLKFFEGKLNLLKKKGGIVTMRIGNGNNPSKITKKSIRTIYHTLSICSIFYNTIAIAVINF